MTPTILILQQSYEAGHRHHPLWLIVVLGVVLAVLAVLVAWCIREAWRSTR